MSLVFKDMKASFLRRAEGDTLFTCDDGPLIREMIAEVATTSGRIERPITVTAMCPSVSGAEPVARFTLHAVLEESGIAPSPDFLTRSTSRERQARARSGRTERRAT